MLVSFTLSLTGRHRGSGRGCSLCFIPLPGKNSMLRSEVYFESWCEVEACIVVSLARKPDFLIARLFLVLCSFAEQID